MLVVPRPSRSPGVLAPPPERGCLFATRRLRAAAILIVTAGAGVLGCTGKQDKPGEPAAPAPAPSAPAANEARDAGPASLAASGDGGPAPYAGPWLGATVLLAPVWSEMDWPNDSRHKRDSDRDSNSVRVGTLRYGERVPVIPEPHKKPNCPEGWYELVSGGFVCGKYVTLDLDHPKFKLARSPDVDGPLPYQYGANVANGTPLYRHIPSREERKKAEPWLFRPKKAKTDDENPYGNGAGGTADGGPIDPGADAPDADVPWWEREVPDGGPPQITLEDLQETGGPVSRRMVKGFFLSLDREVDGSGAKWWKTVSGLSAPFDRIVVTKPVSDFHGVWLGKDDATFATKNAPARRIDKLPVAFVLMHAKRYTVDADRKHATVADGALDRFDAMGLTDEKARIGGVEYWETDEGFWIRAIDATRAEPGPSPDKLEDHEKWIDVNLKRQTLVAFEGATPVFATLFSSGRNEHETPPGSFRIREKHISATMDGDSDTATDGPYSIEDVPYIEYFNAGYALHGAFWHGAFGFVKSHGCVNLAPWDAKAVFGWTEPGLPEGWHAVYATKENPGTRVIVHEKGPGTCNGPKIEPAACPNVPPREARE